MTLTVLQTISLSGRENGVNEDAFGEAPGCAFVIDGATGLGDNVLSGPHGSDAAWLAQFCKQHLEDMVPHGRPIRDVIRQVNGLAGDVFAQALGGASVPAWRQPIAGFSMLRIEEGTAWVHGLGDCALLAMNDEGTLFRHSAMPAQPETEQAFARSRIAAVGGLSKLTLTDEPETLELLKAGRAAYNQPGGKTWTLGTNPDAGDHIASERISLELPLTALLMSDGFAALIDNYGRYDAAGLIRTALTDGLPMLAEELRRIETVDDPEGHAFPRFKVSDDATAVLCRIE